MRSGAEDPRIEQGHLPTMLKFVVASKELAKSALAIDTQYPG